MFKQNLEIIAELNSEDLGAEFGINKFSDLTPEEFRATYTNLKPRTQKFMAHRVSGESSRRATPTAWDWRDHGLVTKVKD